MVPRAHINRKYLKVYHQDDEEKILKMQTYNEKRFRALEANIRQTLEGPHSKVCFIKHELERITNFMAHFICEKEDSYGSHQSNGDSSLVQIWKYGLAALQAGPGLRTG